MELMKWEPFERELSTFRRQMDRLFDSFFGRQSFALSRERLTPAIDLAETPEEISVKAELPGVDEKDISVSLSGDNLIIRGEKKAEKEEKNKSFHRVERWHGSFERVIALPVAIDPEKIKAKYKTGVLEIHLQKKPEVKPKQIQISVK